MSRSLRRGLLVAAFVLVPCPGTVAAGWSAPQDLSGPRDPAHCFVYCLGPPLIQIGSINPAGGMFVAWVASDQQNKLMTAFQAPGREFVRETETSAGAPVALAFDRLGTIYLLSQPFIDTGKACCPGDRCCPRVAISVRPPGGPLGPPKLLSPPDESGSRPFLDVRGPGEVSTFWTEGGVLQLSRRMPGRPFPRGRPIRDSGTFSYSVGLTLGVRGETILAWTDERSETRASLKVAVTRAGTRIASLQTIVSKEAPASIALRADARGRALLVWTDCRRSCRLRAATRPPGGAFGRPVLVAAAGPGEIIDAPMLAMDRRGGAIVAWRLCRREGCRLETAARTPGGSLRRGPGLGRPLPEGAVTKEGPAGIAGSPAGAAILVGRAEDGTLHAATRAPGAPFRAAEVIGSAASRAAPSVAVNDRGDALVVWSDEENRVLASRYQPTSP